MIEVQYSLVIEATADPDFFGFFSPELEGFTGVGHSVEDWPFGGGTSVEGTPFTHPGFGASFPNTGDVGVVVLDTPVVMATYGALPFARDFIDGFLP